MGDRVTGGMSSSLPTSPTDDEKSGLPDSHPAPTTTTPVATVVAPANGGTTAWLQVLSSFLINVNNWGLVYSFGVFEEFYRHKYLVDKSTTSIAWIGTVQASFLLIFGVLSGPLFDQGYQKSLFAGASLGLVIALMMLSLSTQYYQIMLTQGVLLGICSGMLYIPSVAAIPQYFTTRRGLALALGTSGGSIGGVIYPIVFRRMLIELGFPWATRIMGFVALATLAPAAALFRPFGPTKKPTRRLVDKSTITDLPFLAFVITGFVVWCGILVPFFLGSTFAVIELGTSSKIADYLIAILGATQFVGRILSGPLADRFSPEFGFLGAVVAGGVLGFAWIAIHNQGSFIAFLSLYGFVSGMLSTLPAAILPCLCPSMAVYGTRAGMVYGVAGLGVLAGAPSATAAAQASGGFLNAQLFMGSCTMLSALFTLMWLPTVRSRRQAAQAKARADAMAK